MMNRAEQEWPADFAIDAPDHVATYSEACREYASNAGSERPQQAWILTPWDTWERNPSYRGPAVPHPEFDEYEYAEPEYPTAESLKTALARVGLEVQ